MKHLDTLEACLSWLENLHPVEIELGLSRVREVALRLDLLNPSFKVVTIAGTNGKGSATAMLEAALCQLSVSVGCYTSPDMFVFNERVRVDSDNVSDHDIVSALHVIEEARAEISLTYFEYTTLAALWVFQQRGVDVAVLEVGLGGRLDAVNIIDADIAVVTSIGLDHQAWLGDTRDLIAIEKLGVARPDKPLLITEHDLPETMRDSAAATGAISYWIDQDIAIKPIVGQQLVELNLVGHQPLVVETPVSLSLESLLSAVQVLVWLGFSPTALDFQRLAKTALLGRFQYLSLEQGEALVDVAHNPAAVARLVDRLAKEKPHVEFVVCYATMADKDYTEVIRLLASLNVTRWVLPTLNVERALAPDSLQLAIQDQSDKSTTIVNDILPLFGEVRNNQCLLICGSFYTVAACLAAYRNLKVLA